MRSCDSRAKSAWAICPPNWANAQLTDAQLIYAANDAWAAIRVYHALGLVQAAD